MAGFFSFIAGHTRHIVGNTQRKNRNILYAVARHSTEI